jgi:hypothetical protein
VQKNKLKIQKRLAEEMLSKVGLKNDITKRNSPNLCIGLQVNCGEKQVFAIIMIHM